MALIYIVEDDASIREIETIALRNSNYNVQAFEKAAEFESRIGEIIPDLVLLDVMLPDGDGYDIVRRMRQNPQTKRIPVIMVTAKTGEMDMVRGLDGGADDYIRKPFSVMELLSRVKALLRRAGEDAPKLMTVGDVTLDHEKRTVMSGGRHTELTYKEYELLRYLMINAEIVLSRDNIMRFVWGTDYEGESRTVDMHIKTLRKKLGESGKQIATVRNVGYVIHAHPEDNNETED